MSDLYNARGVSAQKEDVHAAIKGLDKGLFPNAFCKILPDFLTGDPEYCCIMHADTAGTKSILAYLYWKESADLSVWKGIAQDALVMNIDDMICAGAKGPFVISSTIARNKNLVPGEVLSGVIQGCESLVQEWKRHGVELQMAGGETADVGDLVKTIDVGYTAFARMKRSEVITIDPQPGDVIVGMASFGQAVYEDSYNSGIGCNGLTSARHDLLNKTYAENFPESYDPSVAEAVRYIGKYKLLDPIEGGNIGKLLLSPTRTFAPIIRDTLTKFREHIHGIVHNTGGAHSKCLKYIPSAVRMIKDRLFDPPLVFRLIQEASGVSSAEMYQVFNMGTRLELYTDADTAKGILEICASYGVEARVIGRVEAAAQKEVRIETAEGSWSYT